MQSIVDWDKLKPYNSDQKKSFEELCFQIAFEEYKSDGFFTPIDDSGGGDGVEFYLTLHNGDIWGWQCKFFGRFSESGRKEQIKKSLHKAYKSHPNLKKWFLCSKNSLTTEEREWFLDELSTSIIDSNSVLPSDHKVTLEHWGDRILNNFLRKYSDIHKYFFNDSILDFNWFEKKYNEVITSSLITPKYHPILHIKTNVDTKIIQLLADERLADYLKKQIEQNQVTMYNKDYKQNLERLQLEKVKPKYKNLWQEFYNFTKDKLNILDEGENLLKNIINIVREKNREQLKLKIKEFELYIEKVKKYYNEYKNLTESKICESIKYSENNTKEIEEIRNLLFEPYYSLDEYGISSLESAFRAVELIDQKSLHISGNAGMGKTHVSVDIYQSQINRKLPAIFLFGRDFKSQQPLSEQIKQILDIPSSWSLDDFWGALNVAGKVYNTKVLIIIDGLNESIHWKIIFSNSLESLINKIENYSNLAIITTYRESYKNQLFPENYFKSGDAWKKIAWVDGFNFSNIDEAIEKYFEYYNIILDNDSHLFDELKFPLYLKIFCETKKGQTVCLNKEDLFDIFEEYLDKCNKNIIQILGKDLKYNKKFTLTKLKLIADYLWKNNTRDIPIEYIIENIFNEDELKAFEGEDLLIWRDYKDQEFVGFTYDLLGGFILAKELVSKYNNSSKIIEFVRSNEFQTLTEKEKLHPLYSDILRSFCILILKNMDLLLFEITDSKISNKHSLISILEINTKYLLDKKDRIKNFAIKQYKQSNKSNFFKAIEKVETVLEHPLNFYFLSDLLKNMSLVKRDLSWTEYLRQEHNFRNNDSEFIGFVEYFEELSKSDKLNSERIHIAARKLIWFLGSTVRALRDLSTRALYYYSKKYPDKFFELLNYSIDINDPYIFERILAATYGLIMSKHNSFNDTNFNEKLLVKYAKFIFDNIFSDQAKYSTTHIITREYARKIIEVCLLHFPDFLSYEEKALINKPFQIGGMRDWQEVYDEYMKSNHPIGLDFGNYTIGSLINDRSPYKDTKEMVQARKRIYWRIYNLGYDKELFKNVDEEIFNRGFKSRGDRPLIERYGKKYSWIAFYELAGYMQDLDLLKDTLSDKGRFAFDIDPSFPEEIEDFKLVNENFLGDNNLPNEEWLSIKESPDFSKYLIVDNLLKNAGTWICLDCSYSTENKEIDRGIFTFIRTFLVKESDYDNFIIHLKKQDLGGRWLPEKHESHSAFHQELDFDIENTYDNFTEMKFVISKRKVIVKKGEPGYFPDIKPKISNEGFSFITKYPKTREIEVKDTVDFDVLMPVMQFYSSNDSITKLNSSVDILSRELIFGLELITCSQTFDLFEKNGAKATISFGNSDDEEYKNYQDFAYIRKDLLDKYLKIKNYKLVWAIWGERQTAQGYVQKVYQEIKEYLS